MKKEKSKKLKLDGTFGKGVVAPNPQEEINKEKQKSNCCNADIEILQDSPEEGTSYYVCSKCRNACDIKPPKQNWEEEYKKVADFLIGRPGYKIIKSFISQIRTQDREDLIDFVNGHYRNWVEKHRGNQTEIPEIYQELTNNLLKEKKCGE